MRKTALYIAMSLDGYIADVQGRIDWLPQGEEGEDFGYDAWIQKVDTILMGGNTYQQITQMLSQETWPYPNQETYVLTHHSFPSQAKVRFYQGDACSLVASLKQKEGKTIWVLGGADVVFQLKEGNMIDQYHIMIVPVLLKQGISLFSPSCSSMETLHFIESKTYGEMVELVYETKAE